MLVTQYDLLNVDFHIKYFGFCNFSGIPQYQSRHIDFCYLRNLNVSTEVKYM